MNFFLEALMSLHEIIGDPRRDPDSDDPKMMTFRLVDVVHGYTFMHFFWLRDQRAAKNGTDAEQGAPPDARKNAGG